MHAETLKRLYRGMLRVRMVEERIAERYPEQEMRCPVHLCIGQEAVAVGVCDNLTATDYVLSGHRSHGHYLAKGGDLCAMMAEIYGKAAGCCSGKGGSMHLVDRSAGFLGAVPIVGSTIPIAVGAAFGGVMQGRDCVAAVFFGDGATEAGVLHESLNFASLKRLPVIFVCENNLYSVYSPLSVRQPEGRPIVELARSHGVEAHECDGNDVLAVHRLAADAVARARDGAGPTFLEFSTYRWLEHCGPCDDSHMGYRSPDEVEQWKARCPIARLERDLLAGGVLDAQEIEELKRTIEIEITEAFACALASPFPQQRALLDYVYAN